MDSRRGTGAEVDGNLSFLMLDDRRNMVAMVHYGILPFILRQAQLFLVTAYCMILS